MGDDRALFTDLMLKTQRAVAALDAITKRDGSKAVALAVEKGKAAYADLRNFWLSAQMTRPEANPVQHFLDLLKARLKYFDASA